MLPSRREDEGLWPKVESLWLGIKFDMIDINGDQKISMYELQSFFASEGQTLTFDDADSIIMEIGGNDEGVIEFNEFKSRVTFMVSAFITKLLVYYNVQCVA